MVIDGDKGNQMLRNIQMGIQIFWMGTDPTNNGGWCLQLITINIGDSALKNVEHHPQILGFKPYVATMTGVVLFHFTGRLWTN
jgi:hypothetical protein